MKTFRPVYLERLSIKWIIFFTVLFIFGFTSRNYMIDSSLHSDVAINQWDILIHFVADGDILYFFIFPFTLLLTGQLLLKEWNYLVLVRNKSYLKWMIYVSNQFLKRLLLIVLLWVLISFIITINIPYGPTWSDNALTNQNPYSLLYAYQSISELSPLLFYMLQIGFISLFLLTVHLINTTLFLLFPRFGTIIFTSLFFFVASLYSFKAFFGWTWINPPVYTLLLYIYSYFDSLLFPIMNHILIISVCFFVISIKAKKYQALSLYKEM